MALINFLTRVYFADRVLEDALAEQMKILGIARPLIVTDEAGATDEPLSRVVDALPPGCASSICYVKVSPTIDVMVSDLKLEQIRIASSDHDCDGFIGLGGEPVLRLVRRAVYQRTYRAYEGPARALQSSAFRKCAPLIAIPTTSACVGLQPILAHEARGSRRMSAADCTMLPDAVLCDPTLTVEQDAHATAAAGMDALTHCLEAYLGMTWNPPADGIALDGIRRAMGNLDQAVHDGSNLRARREMMAAALDAGLASQKGLGAVEALSHALEAEVGHALQHGCLHAALLPVVLSFNAPAICDRMGTLRSILGAGRDLDVMQSFTSLGASIHLPSNLAALKLDSAACQRVAKRAAEHPATRTNPRHIKAADYAWMLEHVE
jgi:4-hydroxybutyrate dehydrogenase